MLAVAHSFALAGVEAVAVRAEVDIHRGLPSFSVVGLPDAAVRESRERVRAAIVNSGFEFPQRRITVSLAPADLRKAGPGFDLAIAAAILAASGQLDPEACARWRLAGELALDGAIRPIRGALAMAERAAVDEAAAIAVPAANAPEAALIDGLAIVPLERLDQLGPLARGELPETPTRGLRECEATGPPLPDLADLRGQPVLRLGLEVAAAGGHSLLVLGPPGAGKSLAARRLPSILPPLALEEAVEVLRIGGVAGTLPPGVNRVLRPFRAPHHTISAAGLIGGGSPPRPGEVTLAHRGVLFLDELGEFSRVALESLRQPLEDRRVTISRAAGSLTFPADFQLIAAANPCPCGHGEDSDRCSCPPGQVQRYRARLSGALADRIDLSLAVEQPDGEALGGAVGEASTEVRERVVAARRRQEQRLGPGKANAAIPDAELHEMVGLDEAGERALAAGKRRLGLSGRGWARTLRVARTCADLDAGEAVGAEHVARALALRGRGEG
jgi:magnesium chelatase family protein